MYYVKEFQRMQKTILIADDEPNLRALIRTTLEEPEYRILEAADGDEAFEIAKKELPDLLVLDWVMPGRTGIEVIQALRQVVRDRTIPFILLTARGQERDKEQGQAVGAQAYLVKPFSPLELIDKVQEVLSSHQARS